MLTLSSLDSQRFGMTVAKASPASPEEVEATLEACRAQGVKLLISRVPGERLALAQRLEERGARLTDVLVYYGRSIAEAREALLKLPAERSGVRIRPAVPADAPAVRDVARRCFQGYLGHYHADPRLDRQACDEVYVDWAHRSCLDPAVGQAVLVGELEGRLIAFATMRLNGPAEAEGVLFGVSPEAQGRGVYRTLIQHSMAWAARQGASQVTYSTQLSNLAVQKVWVREGCEPSHSLLTFHTWFS
jgi:GNAT superfamily N-acetyltransferase